MRRNSTRLTLQKCEVNTWGHLTASRSSQAASREQRRPTGHRPVDRARGAAGGVDAGSADPDGAAADGLGGSAGAAEHGRQSDLPKLRARDSGPRRWRRAISRQSVTGEFENREFGVARRPAPRGARAQRAVTLQASWLDCREFARPSAETSWRAVARTLQDCKHREDDRARCSGAAGAQARQVYSFQHLSIGP